MTDRLQHPTRQSIQIAALGLFLRLNTVQMPLFKECHSFFFILVSRASSDHQARPKQRSFKQRGTEIGSSPMTIFGFPAGLLFGCYSSLYTIAAPLLHPLGRSQPPELSTLPPSSIKAARRAKGWCFAAGTGENPTEPPLGSAALLLPS